MLRELRGVTHLAVTHPSPILFGFRCDLQRSIFFFEIFRATQARKALRALRSLVKLQALVRGYLARKRTAMTLRRLQALMRLQASSRRSVEQVRATNTKNHILKHEIGFVCLYLTPF